MSDLDRLRNDLRNVSGTERLDYINTLVAFSRFAKASGLEPAWQRLYELAQRLDDLMRGIHHPMFEAERLGSGSRPDHSETWERRCRLVAAVEQLHLSGMSYEEAANFVIDSYPQVNDLTSRGEAFSTTILKWRENLETAERSSPLYQWGQILRESRPDLEAIPQNQKRAHAIGLLDRLLLP